MTDSNDVPDRRDTITRRIDSPFGAFYLHVQRAHPGAPPCELGLSIPGTMHDKELGNVLLSLIDAINIYLNSGIISDEPS